MDEELGVDQHKSNVCNLLTSHNCNGKKKQLFKFNN
jgi:hypothetical protein